MKNWMTIGQLAEKTGMTARALRLYEERGILKSHSRSEGEYRIYSDQELVRALQIKELKNLGFSLAEIAQMLTMDSTLSKNNLIRFLIEKKNLLFHEKNILQGQINQMNELLTSLESVNELNTTQRRFIMEEMIAKAKEDIKLRGGIISNNTEEILQKEIEDSKKDHYPQMMEALDIIREIANRHKIVLGPGRGTAAGSLWLYSKGFNQICPSTYGLIPDLFYYANMPVIWIDVAASQSGLLMKELTQVISIEQLKQAQVFIFECPYLDILENLNKKIGTIDFNSIEDESEIVLKPFWDVNLRNIFLFDHPLRSLMNSSVDLDFMIKHRDLKNHIEKKLNTFKVKSVDDILNLMTLSFPGGSKKEILNSYVDDTHSNLRYSYADKEIHKILSNTKGFLLYREQFIKIVQYYTGWSFEECNQFYFIKRKIKKENVIQLSQFEKLVPDEVKKLIDESIHGTFLKSHMVAMWWFVKRSAIAVTLYNEKYLECLSEWSATHNGAWSDLGFIERDYHPLALYW